MYPKSGTRDPELLMGPETRNPGSTLWVRTGIRDQGPNSSVGPRTRKTFKNTFLGHSYVGHGVRL